MCRTPDLYECAKLTLMFISREMAPPSTLCLFLPHSEQNVLKQTSFFTPERTGRLIFALAIKIEEEAPAVSSLELSGRVLRAVPPSCRLTWLWPSPPRFGTGCLALCSSDVGWPFPPTRESRPGPAYPPGANFTLLPPRTLWTRGADISIPQKPHPSVPSPWANPLYLGFRCCPPGFTYI